MIKVPVRDVLTVLLLSGCVGIISVVPAPAASSSSNTRRGELFFAQSCASCHASRSKERLVGPGLRGYYAKQSPAIKDEAVRDVILHGKGTMPGFSTLRQDQIDDLISYLKTL
jgi:mono/diheme cytochrome c family protein